MTITAANVATVSGRRRHSNDDGRRRDLRDDKGGHGERERRHGKDDGIGHDLRDDKGGHGEREHRHGKDDGIGHDRVMTRVVTVSVSTVMARTMAVATIA